MVLGKRHLKLELDVADLFSVFRVCSLTRSDRKLAGNLVVSFFENVRVITSKARIELIRLTLHQQVFSLFDVFDMGSLDSDLRQLVDSLHKVGDVGVAREVLLKHVPICEGAPHLRFRN